MSQPPMDAAAPTKSSIRRSPRPLFLAGSAMRSGMMLGSGRVAGSSE
eukprot:CAMPEP_0172644634 /NCGR_PEP_ID=MMETSP1068-20121228/239308_1 /TAXON_ID=35684 /ORGANISM="Pseudopedinella elastica, Strain CCMP716" /LENGTH=46 /DNA_ID= /DNA_START= /DNA_END= /DNA_ORIENTATION=